MTSVIEFANKLQSFINNKKWSDAIKWIENSHSSCVIHTDKKNDWEIKSKICLNLEVIECNSNALISFKCKEELLQIIESLNGVK